MKTWQILFVMVGVIMSGSHAFPEIVFSEDGTSKYRIVVGADAIPSERYAAEELQSYLLKISGVTLPIVTDAEEAVEEEILLGRNMRLGEAVDFTALSTDAFLLRTKGNKLIIAGDRPRGTLYGVYEVLEKLGVRWFADNVERVPTLERVELPALDETHAPAFAYREVHWREAFRDPDFTARLRINGHHPKLEEKHGGHLQVYHPFVHSMDSLVPPSLFDEHPEYFPLIDGKRVGGYTERCLTNQDVLKIAVARVRQWLHERPNVTIIGVSQNDTPDGQCRCENCTALYEKEGSPAASILSFANAIAEDIAVDYPQIKIDTLAYKSTRKAPKTLRPHPNVIVRLCNIEVCFVHPIAECPSEESAAFRKDIEDWSKIAPTLYIWDYTTNFAHYQMPYPNLDALQPNIQLFAQYGATGVFEQGNSSPGGELSALRAYMLAKLLWNPHLDFEDTMNEFLIGFYGRSAGWVRAYLELMQEQVRDKDIFVTRRTPPTSDHVNAAFIEKAEKILQIAEGEAENDDYRLRVQALRLPLWYVMISTDMVKDEEQTELVRSFVEIARKIGITNIREGGAGNITDWAKKYGVE